MRAVPPQGDPGSDPEQASPPRQGDKGNGAFGGNCDGLRRIGVGGRAPLPGTGPGRCGPIPDVSVWQTGGLSRGGARLRRDVGCGGTRGGIGGCGVARQGAMRVHPQDRSGQILFFKCFVLYLIFRGRCCSEPSALSRSLTFVSVTGPIFHAKARRRKTRRARRVRGSHELQRFSGAFAFFAPSREILLPLAELGGLERARSAGGRVRRAERAGGAAAAAGR